MAEDIRAYFTTSIQRTADVVSFRFVPEKKMDFLPGQFTQVVFDEQDRGNKDLNKYLSFSCAPGKEYFELTKKISGSAFSGRLTALKEGDRVLFRAPLGACVFTPDMNPIGFIVGGIGITPVVSILETIVANGWPNDALLLYSNWTVRDIAFRQELDRFRETGKNIGVVYTLVDCDPDEKSCFTGLITKEFVERHMTDLTKRTIFLLGPPGMVKSMEDICLSCGCAKEHLKIEKFLGY